MSDRLIVSSSPHLREDTSIQKIMVDVAIALIPATIASIYFFKTPAAMILLISIISCLATEVVIQKIRNMPVTIYDGSALVTGMLLALNLPPTVPLWLPVVGSVFAIGIVKQLFGGVGQNFMNPALAARIMLTISYADRMTGWVEPGVDAVSTATPLTYVKDFTTVQQGAPSFVDLLIGNVGGSMGETSALLLIIGGIYLLYRGVISIRIPGVYILTVAIATLLYSGFNIEYMTFHLLSGSLMIGAIYMATDYASTPVTPRGRIYFALGCGILTATIRLFGGYAEGVGFSILLMNTMVPLIDRYTAPKVFGEVKKQNA